MEIGNFGIFFTGDMEVPGWQKMLEREDFKKALAKVSVFVASHHGRENGYCPELFEFCKPQIIVISDKDYEHETQEVDYGPHAAGITYQGKNRLVFSTRHDGTLFLDRNANGSFVLSTEH